MVLIWLQSDKQLFWWADFTVCSLGTARWAWLQNGSMADTDRAVDLLEMGKPLTRAVTLLMFMVTV